MNIRRTTATLAIGALTVVGGVAAGPPDEAQSENGCQGIQEAQGDNGGNGQTDGTPAEPVLKEVEALLNGGEECDEEAASGDNGRPGEDS